MTAKFKVGQKVQIVRNGHYLNKIMEVKGFKYTFSQPRYKVKISRKKHAHYFEHELQFVGNSIDFILKD